MSSKYLLSLNTLKEFLYYCPLTGIFTWIKIPGRKIKLGSIAGSISKRDSHIEIRLLGKLYRASILAWFYSNGQWPEGYIDHIDHNEQNNSLSNLRDVSKAENNKNQSKKANNTSGVTGVWINNKNSNKKYIAEIKVNNRKIYLGGFQSLEEAKKARKAAEILYGYHDNHGMCKPLQGSTTIL